jgi:ankyrin repeat protein
MDRCDRFHARLSTLLFAAAMVAVMWPLADVPRLYRLARGEPGNTQQMLLNATVVGDVDAVRRLLEQGVPADATDGGYTALMVAEDPTIARLLLAHGADPCACRCHQSPLLHAVTHGNTEMVRTLLDAGADPHQHPRDALPLIEIARTYDERAVVDLLLERTTPQSGRGSARADHALHGPPPLSLARGATAHDLTPLAP